MNSLNNLYSTSEGNRKDERRAVDPSQEALYTRSYVNPGMIVDIWIIVLIKYVARNHPLQAYCKLTCIFSNLGAFGTASSAYQ